MIRLDRHPGWAGSIQWVGIGWIGSAVNIEIERAELRPMTFVDWMAYEWLQFWTPEFLAPLAVHVIPGPRMFDLPFSAVLTVLCLASIAIVVSTGVRGAREPLRALTVIWSRTRVSAGLVLLIGFWIVFDLRTAYNHFQTLASERRHFHDKPVGERHYFELDDLSDFLDAVDRRVPEGTPVAFFSGMPHDFHARYRLYPRRVMMRDTAAPYIAMFQDPTITFQNGRLVARGIPLQGRFEQFWRFGPSAVIFRHLDD
jgi:hypothetical protein